MSTTAPCTGNTFSTLLRFAELPKNLGFLDQIAYLCSKKSAFLLAEFYEACFEYWVYECREDFESDIALEVEKGNMEVLVEGKVYRFTGKEFMGEGASSGSKTRKRKNIDEHLGVRRAKMDKY